MDKQRKEPLIGEDAERVPELPADHFEFGEFKGPTPEEFYADLSDPRAHDPKRFCYVVHGINPYAYRDLPQFVREQRAYDPTQDVDLLKDLERIVEKKIISTSIISEAHTETWGNVFYILEVPWPNFVAMSPEMRKTLIHHPVFELEGARPPYTTPRKFTAASRGMNEVVVTGNKEGATVRIIGIGIKLIEYGGEAPLQPPEAELMRLQAQRLGVPVVEIVERSRIEDSTPEVFYGFGDEWRRTHDDSSRIVQGVYVNRNGYRYCFVGDWEENALREVRKSDWNIARRGNNPITREEYIQLRPEIEQKLTTDMGRDFLHRLDEYFKAGHEE
jgi:hypothetical protein